MKHTFFYSLFALSIFVGTCSFAQTAHHAAKKWSGSYPPEGSATTDARKELNRDKNQSSAVPTGTHTTWDINAPKSECVILEITPDFKSSHPYYEQYLHNNIPIAVSGYLLYDIEHRPQATKNYTTCTNTWRKTCWEIHPIVSIRE